MKRLTWLLLFVAMILALSGCASAVSLTGPYELTSEYGTPYAGGRYMCINGTCIDREDRGDEEDGR